MKEFLLCLAVILIGMAMFFGWIAGIGALLCMVMNDVLAYILAFVSFPFVIAIIFSIIEKKPIVEVLNEIAEA